MEEYEYESVRFPYAMKDYSQVVIYERFRRSLQLGVMLKSLADYEK